MVRAGAADCGSPIKSSGASPSWPHTVVQHTAAPGSTLHTRPRPQRSQHAFHMCHLERCLYRCSRSLILNKPPRLFLSKGKYYSPSPKIQQVKCGFIWWKDTTFACELHNCYGLWALKPLIPTTWWICRSTFKQEVETNFQSRSTLRYWWFVSAVPDMSGPRISCPLLVFQKCLVWEWQVAFDLSHTLCCSTAGNIA